MSHTKVLGDFAQLDAARRKDTSQQTFAAEVVDPVTPGLGLTPSRSKIPANSAEIEAFPCRKSRPV